MSFSFSRAAVLAALMGSSTLVGCTTSAPPEPIGGTSSKLLAPRAVIKFTASTSTKTSLGITQWRMFVGRKQAILTGFDAQGTARRGFALSYVKSHAGARARVEMRMLDGSHLVVSRAFGGRATASAAPKQAQLELLAHAFIDLRSATTKFGTHRKGKFHAGTSDACNDAWANNGFGMWAGGVACLATGFGLGAPGWIGKGLGLLGSWIPSLPSCGSGFQNAVPIATACNPGNPENQGCTVDMDMAICTPMPRTPANNSNAGNAAQDNAGANDPNAQQQDPNDPNAQEDPNDPNAQGPDDTMPDDAEPTVDNAADVQSESCESCADDGSNDVASNEDTGDVSSVDSSDDSGGDTSGGDDSSEAAFTRLRFSR